jgi:hypothetical protein
VTAIPQFSQQVITAVPSDSVLNQQQSSYHHQLQQAVAHQIQQQQQQILSDFQRYAGQNSQTNPYFSCLGPSSTLATASSVTGASSLLMQTQNQTAGHHNYIHSI